MAHVHLYVPTENMMKERPGCQSLPWQSQKKSVMRKCNEKCFGNNTHIRDNGIPAEFCSPPGLKLKRASHEAPARPPLGSHSISTPPVFKTGMCGSVLRAVKRYRVSVGVEAGVGRCLCQNDELLRKCGKQEAGETHPHSGSYNCHLSDPHTGRNEDRRWK